MSILYLLWFPAEILQANDKLSQALGQYRQVVVSQENGDGAGSAASSAHAPGEKHPQRPMAALPCMPGGSGVWEGSASQRINVENVL